MGCQVDHQLASLTRQVESGRAIGEAVLKAMEGEHDQSNTSSDCDSNGSESSDEEDAQLILETDTSNTFKDSKNEEPSVAPEAIGRHGRKKATRTNSGKLNIMKFRESIMGDTVSEQETSNIEPSQDKAEEGDQDRRARRRLVPSKTNFGKNNSLGVVD